MRSFGVRSGSAIVALLSLAHMMSFVDRLLIGLLAEPLKAEFGLSDTAIGLLQGTGFVILYSLAAIPFGLAADRGNRRNIIIAGILVWSAATAGCGLAPGFAALFVARVGVGLGEAALVPAAMSLIAAVLPRKQLGRGVAIFIAGGAFGRSLALLGGGLVLALLAGWGGLDVPGIGLLPPWRGTFVLMAVPGLFIALLLLLVREPARERPAGEQRQGLVEAWGHVRSRARAYALHSGAAACVILISQTFAAWSPSLFVRSYELTAAQAGMALGLTLLVAAPLGNFASGALMDHLVARQSRAPAVAAMILGQAGAAVSILLLLAMPTLMTALPCFALACFFIALGSPAPLACVQMLAPAPLRGVVSALFLAATTLVGIGLGPLLVGLASDLLGGARHLDTALGSVLLFFAALGIPLAWLSRRPFAEALALSSSNLSSQKPTLSQL